MARQKSPNSAESHDPRQPDTASLIIVRQKSWNLSQSHHPRQPDKAGPPMKRENPTPEFNFSGPSSHETRMTGPVVRASLVDWNSLDFRDLGSRFIAGLALHQWTFSRCMSGPTLGPDGAVSRRSAR